MKDYIMRVRVSLVLDISLNYKNKVYLIKLALKLAK